jgi:hypothetical protein
MDAKLIAPCGMNCGLCIAFLREKNRCPGCRESYGKEPITRARCAIKTCAELKKRGWRFCSDRCERYPCARLESLDKRYRTKYGMSMIENLGSIRKDGIRRFLEMERKRWTKCGKIFCVHDKKYHTRGK